MKAKNVLYAAVGAPVVAARKVGTRATDLSTKLSEQANQYSQSLEEALDSWATEGEKMVTRIRQGKVVDELTSKVDLDQAKEQVSKLRDQLEDMLSTWRASFRPEKADSGEIETTVATSDEATVGATHAETSASEAKEPTAENTGIESGSESEIDQAS